MNFFILSAVLLVAIIGSIQADHNPLPHYFMRKGFPEAQAECAVYLRVPQERLQRYMREGYPDEPEVHCLVLCVLENLRAWENGTLQEHVLVNYFVPAAEDCDNVKRTERCLVNLPQECNGEPCVQAYRAFQCYYQNYGTLTNCPEYVPSYYGEDLQEVFDLFLMLDTSEDTRKKLAGGCFPSGPESQCFFYAYLLRYGAWEKDEPLLHNLYTQTNEDAFKKDNAETQACLTNLNKLACNKSKCEHATDVFVQCFGHTNLYKHLLAVFKDGAQKFTKH
ncbi:uncharacterized protein LOC126559636 [Anopheles maculipalpis]|uniref:uncharacterized protein LOC126559636 n=1 Tax=Anopheles maculipalpis TaxID=1496333 RepID=UPI002158E6AD|nr:uncharacterized protein LOC126559636 [Anopheles maculipalpis]